MTRLRFSNLIRWDKQNDHDIPENSKKDRHIKEHVNGNKMKSLFEDGENHRAKDLALSLCCSYCWLAVHLFLKQDFLNVLLECFLEEVLECIVNEPAISLYLCMLRHKEKSYSLISSAVWKIVINKFYI